MTVTNIHGAAGRAMKMLRRGRMKSRSAGFTLIEIAIVMVVIAVLLASIAVPLATQVEIRRTADTQRTLETVKDALLGYAVSRSGAPFFPCPDNNLDGLEDRVPPVTGACTANEGWLPWQTLGLAQTGPLSDGWGNLFRYRVVPEYSNSTGFALSPPTTIAAPIRVCTTSACTATLATGLPLVVVSHGKNGFGARSITGFLNPAPASADELENTNGRNAADTADTANVNFVSHVQSMPGATEFDDIVVWLPTSIIFSKMVAAGKLP
jgi:prepilin-type N-terminal cleavage/methylation domain-containing protein